MLRRTLLRQYLLALLCDENTPQTKDCQKGPLWKNCDDSPIMVDDSAAHQLDEDTEPGCGLKSNEAQIDFRIERENYAAAGCSICSLTTTFQIDIVACAAQGHRRQDILDEIQERILIRIYSRVDYIHATHGYTLTSFMGWIRDNSLNISVEDDTEYDGSYTVRTMTFSFTANDCCKAPECPTQSVCFDFDKLLPPSDLKG